MRDAENSAGKQQACKHGFPAAKITTNMKSADSVFLFGGVENMTYALCSGKEISPDVVATAFGLIQRVKAMEEALEHRIAVQYPESLVEEVA
jgi:hypothetical protein